MNCDAWTESLIDRLAGELGEDETVILEQHLDDCPVCREEERRLRALLATQSPDLEWAPNDGILPRLLERMRLEACSGSDPCLRPRNSRTSGRGREPAGVLGLLWRPVPSFAMIALLVVTTAGGIWIGRSSRADRAPTSAGPVTIDRIPIDLPGKDAPPFPHPGETKGAALRAAPPMVANSFLEGIGFVPTRADAMELSAAAERDSL